MKEKLIMNRLESIELFSEETLSTMEIRGIVGGDYDALADFICIKNDCDNVKNCDVTTTTHSNCSTCTPTNVKAVALDCSGSGGTFKGLCQITPVP